MLDFSNQITNVKHYNHNSRFRLSLENNLNSRFINDHSQNRQREKGRDEGSEEGREGEK